MTTQRTGAATALVGLALGLHGCGKDLPRARGFFQETTDDWLPPENDTPWPDGTFFLPEIMQGGVGLFDADGDGDLDLFHVRVPPPGGSERSITNRLFRHEDDGRFVDVSAESGIVESGFGQGLAVGDTDNDGDLEVYVTNYGADVFHQNDGTGRFANETSAAGFSGAQWSTAAAFCDYDADGFQDLYVVHYLDYDAGKRCTDPSDRPEYCGPRSFNGVPDTLYRNRGDGSFEDATRAAGIQLPQGGARASGLGIAFADLTKDGLPDVFVANDAQANQLWVNEGNGHFSEQGIQRGVALDRNGRPEASMGVALADIDGDLLPDLLTTHLWEENNRLYTSTAGPLFRDRTVESQLSRHDLERTGFGCGFFDFDHDGDRDLAVVNGAVRKRPAVPGGPPGMWAEYAEPNQLFENDGRGVFTLVDEQAGAFASQVEVSRGLALGDLDADGDLDLALSNADNRLRVFRNDAPPAGAHWLLVRLMTRGRDALGAGVRVRAGGKDRVGFALGALSYCSSSDPRAHIGLGPSSTIEEFEVSWPDGTRELFPGSAADREVVLRQGEGRRP